MRPLGHRCAVPGPAPTSPPSCHRPRDAIRLWIVAADLALLRPLNCELPSGLDRRSREYAGSRESRCTREREDRGQSRVSGAVVGPFVVPPCRPGFVARGAMREREHEHDRPGCRAEPHSGWVSGLMRGVGHPSAAAGSMSVACRRGPAPFQRRPAGAHWAAPIPRSHHAHARHDHRRRTRRTHSCPRPARPRNPGHGLRGGVLPDGAHAGRDARHPRLQRTARPQGGRPDGRVPRHRPGGPPGDAGPRPGRDRPARQGRRRHGRTPRGATRRPATDPARLTPGRHRPVGAQGQRHPRPRRAAATR